MNKNVLKNTIMSFLVLTVLSTLSAQRKKTSKHTSSVELYSTHKTTKKKKKSENKLLQKILILAFGNMPPRTFGFNQ